MAKQPPRKKRRHHLRHAIQALYAQTPYKGGKYEVRLARSPWDNRVVFLAGQQAVVAWDLRSRSMCAHRDAALTKLKLVNLILLRLGAYIEHGQEWDEDKWGRKVKVPVVRVHSPRRDRPGLWLFSTLQDPDRSPRFIAVTPMPTSVYEQIVLLDRGPPP